MLEASRVDLLLCWGQVTGLGGTESRMAEVVELLVAQGVTVASTSTSGGVESTPLGEVMRASGAAICESGSTVELRQLLQRLRPRAAIAHGLKASLALRAATAMVRHPPQVLDARNGLEFGRPARTWMIDRITQCRVDIYMTNSAEAAEVLLTNGIRGQRVKTNPSALADRWYEQSKLARDPTRIIIVGSHRPEKNHPFALRAIARCIGEVHAEVYTNDGRELEDLWKSLRVPGDKHLQIHEGHTMQPDDYARASVLFHPSLSESLPKAILEAKAQGVRVVASPVGAVPGLLTGTDFECSTTDVDDAASKLEAALDCSRQRLPTDDGPRRVLADYCGRLLELCGLSA